MERNFRITVNGREYHVAVEELSEQGQPHGPTAIMPPVAGGSVPVSPPSGGAAPPVGGPGDVTAPMSGVVASVEVSSGQAVMAGERLVTLEAMKMNTPVVAPRGGTVTRVLVKPGDAVEGGQPLVTLA